MHFLEISINKCKGKANSVPFPQSIIKLVYDVALTKKPHRALRRGRRDPSRSKKMAKESEEEVNAVETICWESS